MERPLERLSIIGDVHAEDIALATALDALRAMQADAIGSGDRMYSLVDPCPSQ